jgi:isoleucyl-tRNA synthetase
VDLSAFYVDVSKDRLYTFGAGSASAVGADGDVPMADGLARLIAPILPVTADELWRHLPGAARRRCTSRCSPTTSRRWLDPPARGALDAAARRARRGQRRLEAQRQEKVIGTSLEARVTLRRPGGGALLARPVAELLAASSSSATSARRLDAAPRHHARPAPETLTVVVSRAAGVKCQRCWRYVPRSQRGPEHAGLCDRCVEALGLTRADSARRAGRRAPMVAPRPDGAGQALVVAVLLVGARPAHQGSCAAHRAARQRGP